GRWSAGIRPLFRNDGCTYASRWGPRFFSSAPPRSPAPPFDHFPFGPAILRRRVSRALGCGGIFPRDQQAGARVRKRRREGNEWAARVGRRYTIQRAIRWLRSSGQVGPSILFECPAQIPRSSLRSFSLWARHSAATSATLNWPWGWAE